MPVMYNFLEKTFFLCSNDSGKVFLAVSNSTLVSVGITILMKKSSLLANYFHLMGSFISSSVQYIGREYESYERKE
jgi:hypothetical protein